MRRLLSMLMAAAVLSAPAARADTDIERMSAPEAADFLRGLLIAQGKIVFHVDYLDSQDDTTWSHEFSFEYEDITIRPDGCYLGMRHITSIDGKVTEDLEGAGVYFGKVDAVTRGTDAAFRQQKMAQEGHPMWRASVTPDIWVMRTVDPTGVFPFRFYGRTMAEQAAQAAARLRALCKPS
jgi:hypothetical protein